jgi:hypothetical protein
MNDNLKKRYYICWVDRMGNAGHGQPIFSTKEEALEHVKVLNKKHKGEITHGVGRV